MDRWYTAAGFLADWAVSSSTGWLIVLNFVKISNWKLEIRRLRNTGSLRTTRIIVSSSVARFIVNSQHFFLYSLQTRQIEKVKWVRHDLVAPLDFTFKYKKRKFIWLLIRNSKHFCSSQYLFYQRSYD